jgi:thioredoxin reductase (NADPH)
MPDRDLVIIGSGPAGYTAALYAARANLKPLMFEGFQKGGIPGGQLMLTTEVENFPGFPEGVTGPELMKRCRDQALRFGTEILGEDVESVDFSRPPFTVSGTDTKAEARAVIIATGANAQYLGLASEERLKNKGVSACAVCDGAIPIFRNQSLVVVGGGDSAVEESTYLTKYGSRIYLVHRRDTLRASKIMQARVASNPKITPIWNTQVVEVLGKDKVEGVRLKDLKSGDERVQPCAGLFLAIGHKPNTDFLKGHLALDAKGYVVLTQRTLTSVEGVFAAGDVADHTYRQAITAAGTGCAAALDAERWLEAQGAHGATAR